MLCCLGLLAHVEQLLILDLDEQDNADNLQEQDNAGNTALHYARACAALHNYPSLKICASLSSLSSAKEAIQNNLGLTADDVEMGGGCEQLLKYRV